MGCKFVYNDVDGKPSVIYERALQKYGPERAEEIYLNYMMRKLDTRYSSPIVRKLDEHADDIEVASDLREEDVNSNNVYINKTTGKQYDRVTRILNLFITRGKSMIPISKEESLIKAKTEQARNIIKNRAPVDMNQDMYLTEQLVKDPTIVDSVAADIQKKWDASTYWGTEFHKVADAFIKAWEGLQTYDSNGKRSSTLDVNSNVYKALGIAEKSLGPDVYKPGTLNKKFETNQLASIFIPLMNEIQGIERKINKTLKLKSELKVYTDQLKYKNSSTSGLAGSLDIIGLTDDNKFNLSVDFKTKPYDKVADFDKLTGTVIEGPFDSIDNTSESRALCQQILYGSILKAEYGVNLTHAISVVVPINFGEKPGFDIDGSKEYELKSIGSKPVITKPESIEDRIETVLTYFREGGDLGSFYKKIRASGIVGVTEKWSGKQEDGQPNATFSKYHKEPYIKTKLAQKRTTSKGKTVVDIFAKTIDVTGKTDEQIKDILDKEYDNNQETQNRIAPDVIRWFKHQERLPKSLEGRQTALSFLLKDIKPETHTLLLAQGEKGLESIGPDVIIAKNNITGTVTLLSAVTTTKGPVKFKGDGSKESRKSFLGNYVTDKVLESGDISDNLLKEPNTHDYIAMKLGVAALYLNKNNNNKLNVNGIRVCSMGYGEKVSVTNESLETQLEKLKMVRKYAGEDFPDEYSELLDITEKYNTDIASGKYLENLIAQIKENTDPLGTMYRVDLKNNVYKIYQQYQAGELVGSELKKALGNYSEAVAKRITPGKSKTQIQEDPRYLAASHAYLEFLGFENDLGRLAQERLSTPFLRSAITSGDKMQMGLHVQYNTASANIRSEMNDFSKEHKKILSDLMKDKNVTWIGDTKNMFDNLYIKSDKPEDRMTLKSENSDEFKKLSKAEQNYIVFFNKHIKDALVRVASEKRRPDVVNERFWREGTVPAILGTPSLMRPENFTSWTKLKNAWSENVKTLYKKTTPTSSLLEFNYATQFDEQAEDETPGHSAKRRKLLGIEDLNAPKDQNINLEKNLAMILNLAKLEASEKENYSNLLQTVEAVQALLVNEGDRAKLSIEMIDHWRRMVIFSRYDQEPLENLTHFIDVSNRASSAYLFALSIRQAMIEFSTGTLQNGSALMSNMIQNAVGSFIGTKGRFTLKDWGWAVNAWSVNYGNRKLQQIVYDGGVLCADSDDLKTEEFMGKNKSQTFASKAAYYLNRLFFNTSITHTYLAQLKNMGITEAYVKKGENWAYDETLDPRFFVYDKDRGLGKYPPSTDEEKKKYSLWKATREQLDKEGLLDKETKRMLVPMTENERAEIKQYATRLYGSFNKDVILDGEAKTIGRAMLRYKKWWPGRLANYWTPTIHDSKLYGHWSQEVDLESGEYRTTWVGDDYQGIIQTVGFMMTELARTKSLAFTTKLNKYQRENLSKLMSDMILVFMMTLMVLPFIQDEEEVVDPVTGESKMVKGDFSKSQVGTNVFKATVNAVQDMSFMGSMSNMTENIFPVLSVFSTSCSNAWSGIGDMVSGESEKAKTDFKKLINTGGYGKTFYTGAEILSGNLTTTL